MKENFTYYTYTKLPSFYTLTMILDKRVKSQGVSEEEHDFIIAAPMNHYGVSLRHEGIDISKSCFISLTP